MQLSTFMVQISIVIELNLHIKAVECENIRHDPQVVIPDFAKVNLHEIKSLFKVI